MEELTGEIPEMEVRAEKPDVKSAFLRGMEEAGGKFAHEVDKVG